MHGEFAHQLLAQNGRRAHRHNQGLTFCHKLAAAFGRAQILAFGHRTHEILRKRQALFQFVFKGLSSLFLDEAIGIMLGR